MVVTFFLGWNMYSNAMFKKCFYALCTFSTNVPTHWICFLPPWLNFDRFLFKYTLLQFDDLPFYLINVNLFALLLFCLFCLLLFFSYIMRNMSWPIYDMLSQGLDCSDNSDNALCVGKHWNLLYLLSNIFTTILVSTLSNLFSIIITFALIGCYKTNLDPTDNSII